MQNIDLGSDKGEKMKKLVCMAVASLLFVVSADAKNSSPIKLTTKSYKEVVKIDSSGKKKVILVDAKKVIPGDVVLYKNIIKNNSTTDAKDMVLNNTIPLHTIYVLNSATCEGDCKILFSVDGGKHFARPKELKVKGNGVERVATANDYTNVRWILSKLDTNRETSVSFKTKLK